MDPIPPGADPHTAMVGLAIVLITMTLITAVALFERRNSAPLPPTPGPFFAASRRSPPVACGKFVPHQDEGNPMSLQVTATRGGGHYEERPTAYPPLELDRYKAFRASVFLQDTTRTRLHWECPHQHDTYTTAAACAQGELRTKIEAHRAWLATGTKVFGLTPNGLWENISMT